MSRLVLGRIEGSWRFRNSVIPTADFVVPTGPAGERIVLTFVPDAGVCAVADSLVTFRRAPVTPALLAGRVCELESTFDLSTLVVDPSLRGGVWSGVPTANLDGATLDLRGLPAGDLNLRYLAPGQCAAEVTTVLVRDASAKPVIADQDVCEFTLPLQLDGLVPAGFEGGVWSGAGVVGGNVFDPGAQPATSYRLRYGFADSLTRCVGSVGVTIEVGRSGTPRLRDTSICRQGEILDLFFLADPRFRDGVWTVVGSEVDLLRRLDPKAYASLAEVRLRFTPAGGSECTQAAFATVTLTDEVVLTLKKDTVCANGGAYDLSQLLPPGTPRGEWLGPPSVSISRGLLNTDGLSAGLLELRFKTRDVCFAEAVTTLLISEGQGITLAEDVRVCRLDSAFDLRQLLPDPSLSGTWEVAPAAAVTGDLLDVRQLTLGSNQVTFKLGSGCSSQGSTVIEVLGLVPYLTARDTIRYCPRDSGLDLDELLPVIVVGGVWAGGPGLNGSVLDVSVAGNYAVTYTPPSTICAAPRSIIITVAPPDDVPLRDTTLCGDIQTLDLNRLVPPRFAGGLWSRNGSNVSGGQLDVSSLAPGAYELDYRLAGACAPFGKTTITLGAQPVANVRDTSVCDSLGVLNLADLVAPGSEGGRWSGPGVTDGGYRINGPRQTQLNYRLTSPEGCVAETTAEVEVVRTLRIRIDSTSICTDEALLLDLLLPASSPPGTWLDESGALITEVISAVPTRRRVTFVPQADARCAVGTGVVINIRAGGEIAFAPITLCGDASPLVLSTLATGAAVGGSWSDANGNLVTEFDPNVSGSTTLNFTSSNGGCTFTGRLQINVLPSDRPVLVRGVSACRLATDFDLATLLADGSLVGDWLIGRDTLKALDPSRYPAGPLRLTFARRDNCRDTASVLLRIVEGQPVRLRSATLCPEPGNFNLNTLLLDRSVAGTWRGDGLSIVDSLLATAGLADGSYVLTFEPAGGCLVENTVTIQIATGAAPALRELSLCVSGGAIPVDSALVTAGRGTWSINGVAVDSIRPSVLGEGAKRLLFTPVDACLDTASTLVTVVPERVYTLTPISVCASATGLALDDFAPAGLTGGTWSGPGVRNDSLSRATAGVYELTYTPPAGACAGPRRVLATVRAGSTPVLRPTTICAAAGPIALASLGDESLPSGEWSGSRGIRGQVFDPALVGPGSYTLVFTPTGECAQPAQVVVQVQGSGTPVLQSATVCASQTDYDLSALLDPAFPAGTWRIAGTLVPGGILDASSYPAGALSLTFEPTGGCASDATTTVTIAPGYAAQMRDLTVCVGSGAVALVDFFDQVPLRGTWTGTDISLSADSVLLSGVDSGRYSLVFTPDTACALSTRVTLTVEGRLVRDSLTQRRFCLATTSVDLDELLPQALRDGVWSGPAVSDNTFSPANYGREGLDTLVYRFGESCPQIIRLPILVRSSVELSVDTLSFCADGGDVVLATYDPDEAPGGTWTLRGEAVSSVASAAFPSGAPLQFTYTPPTGAGTCAAGPVERFLLKTDATTVTLALDSVCVEDGVVDLADFTLPASATGVWSGAGVTPAGLYTAGRFDGATVITFAPSGGCYDSASFTFNLVDVGALKAEAPTFSCTGNTYTATVVMDTHSNNGVITPSLGTLVGTLLTVTNLASGTPASVLLSDEATCSADLVVTLDYTCSQVACEANAGTFDVGNYIACEGEAIRFPETSGAKLAPGVDILRYVLDSDDDFVNGTLTTSATPSFPYDATYANRVLTIYAIAGADDGTGQVRITDPCVNRSAVGTARWLRPASEAVAGNPVCAPDDATYTVAVTLPGEVFDYVFTGATPSRSTAGSRIVTFGPIPTGTAPDIVIEGFLSCGRFEYREVTSCGANCRPASAGTFQAGPVDLCTGGYSTRAGYNQDARLRPGDGQIYVVYADPQRRVLIDSFRSLPIDFAPYRTRGTVYLASRVGVRRNDGTLDPACSIETSALQTIRFGESPAAARDTIVCGLAPVTLYGVRFDPTANVRTVNVKSPSGGCDTALTLTVLFVVDDKIVIRGQELCEGETRTIGGRVFDVDNPGAQFSVGNASCRTDYDVLFTFKPAARNSITVELCRGDSLVRGNEVFNVARPSGVVRLKAKNGCDSLLTVNVLFPDPPTVSFAVDPIACNAVEAQVAFTVSGTRAVSALLQNGSGASEPITLPAGTSTRTFPITGDLNLRITEVAATSGGCRPSPQAAFTVRQEVSRLESRIDVPLAGELEACPGSPVPSITVETTRGVAPFRYLWSRGDTTRTILDADVGEYSVVVTDSFGCTSESTVRVAAADTVEYVITETNPICPDGFGSLSIDLLDTPPGLRYRFDLPGLRPVTNSVITVDSLASGRYVFQLLQERGCSQNTFVDIVAPTRPNPIVPDTITTRLGQPVELSVPYSPPAVIQWNPSEAFSCDSCALTTVFPTGSGLVGVQIMDSLGCEISDAVYLLVEPGFNVFIPNAFSPNDDGVNDVLMPLMGPEVRRVLSFEVYSRWGEPVHQRYDFVPGDSDGAWDGRWKAQTMDTGVFVAKVKVELINGEEEVVTGDVGLFR